MSTTAVHHTQNHAGHDHYDDHHHQETFLTKYIFSQDHKMIGTQFLIIGIIMAVIGMFVSILFRISLG